MTFTEEQYQQLKQFERKRYSARICKICKVNEEIWFYKQQDGMYTLASCCGGFELGGWHGMIGIPGKSFFDEISEQEYQKLLDDYHNFELIPSFEIIVQKVLRNQPLENPYCGLLACDAGQNHVH